MEQEGAPPNRKLRLKGDFITLKVGTGNQRETFSAHENLVKADSEFFRIAFDKKWKEGQSREIELPDDEPRIVNLFLEFLYNKDSLRALVMSGPYPWPRATYRKLCKLYVFGEKIQMSVLCNSAIDAILDLTERPDKLGTHWYPAREHVDVIYEGTPPSSPARALMVHLHVNHGGQDWLRDSGNHPEFLLDLAVGLLKSRPKPQNQDFFNPREIWHKK